MRQLQILTVNILFFLLPASNALAQDPPPGGYQSNVKINYVRSWVATAPETNPANLAGRPLKDVKQTTVYMDGLGRPLQTVVKQSSYPTYGTASDVVSPVVYDEVGREVYKYLPFTARTTGVNTSVSDGGFKLDPFEQQKLFSAGQYPGETYFYGKTDFEPTPLNRPSKVKPAGNNWSGADRGIATKYWVNAVADDVKMWAVSYPAGNGEQGTYTMAGAYPAGELFKNITIDEHDKQVIEFKDKEDRIILKKVQLSASPDNGMGSQYPGWLCTYYLYDNLNNLRLVIQPKGVEILASNNWQLTASILHEFCFRYEYDDLNRMVVKKVPGAGEVWMVYDARDRLVLKMDSLLRGLTPLRWVYTRYDGLNRPIATGLWNNAQNRQYHKTQAYNSTGYPNLTGQTIEELTWTYYDDYAWASSLPAALKDFDISYTSSYLLPVSSNNYPYPQAVEKTAVTAGLVTGIKAKALGINPVVNLVTINFYDEKGRVIQTRSQNISGGVDVVTTQYSWSGLPLVIVQKQEKAGTNLQIHIIVTKMEYDDLGRVLTIKKTIKSTINGQTIVKPEQVLVSNQYDALGELKKKYLGSPVIDSLVYDYNIRGWLLGANRNYVKEISHHKFGFELGYDNPTTIVSGSTYSNQQFNGNISGIIWKSMGDHERRKYDFTYDATNRLMGATFTQYTGGSFNTNANIDFTVKGLSYDANGNILTMNQRGLKLGGSVIIDSLLYTYENNNNSNKLKNVLDRVNDTATRLGDFRSSKQYMTALGNNKTNIATDYVYDGNGNTLKDLNKDLGDGSTSGIRYNYLNQPHTIIRITAGGTVKDTILYTYDALGNKLKKQVKEKGKPVKTTLYVGGLVYENDTLQFISHEEGRIRYVKRFYTNGTSSYDLVYDYFLKDHQGNVRMVLTEQKDTSYYMARMEPEWRAYEEKLFANIPETATPIPPGYPSYPEANAYVAKVNGSGRKVGPAILLKVMAGDVIKLGTLSFYKSQSSSGSNQSPVNDLLSALAGAIVGVSGDAKGTLGQLGNPTTSPLTGVLNSFRTLKNPDPPAGKPKAFLNWLVLDEQLKDVPTGSQSGALPVGTTDALTPLSPADLVINKNGYVYIYVSNETENWDVFFDNLWVHHLTGPLLEETHYYPFGLTMAGISSKAFGKLENKKEKFQGQEFNDALDVDYYEFKYRTHDPQIGRFIQIDPLADKYPHNSTYAFSENKVTAHVELEGLEAIPYNNPKQVLYQGGGDISKGIAGLVDKLRVFFGFATEVEKPTSAPNVKQVTIIETKTSIGTNFLGFIDYVQLNNSGEGYQGSFIKMETKTTGKTGVKVEIPGGSVKTLAVDDGSVETKLEGSVKLNQVPMTFGLAATSNNQTGDTKVKGEVGTGFDKIKAKGTVEVANTQKSTTSSIGGSIEYKSGNIKKSISLGISF